MIHLRPIRKQDEASLYRVYASTRAEELQQLDWDEQAKQHFLAGQFNAQQSYYMQLYPNAEFQVILRGREPIGRLYVDRGDVEIRLIDIALIPEFQGNGIGTGLLKALLAEAHRSDLPLRLHVDKANTAIRLYRRLGFREIEDIGMSFLMEWTAAGPSAG